ncbi:NAD(P)-dependent oxidoreductase [Pikeienuella piscinae]|uniref:NAD(P)-dependent oxidoreductase n=1 Tax=Pikeienuella piscinae TaxID=2748098 RepID=A0A7L5C2A1_9RHOB|nr:NAD(P)-binding domain-containing protein [Pikeienuella piscinae]QIE56304.1 NAD(P)-dependent oxidoreductase [Pikeienuella piscinae]
MALSKNITVAGCGRMGLPMARALRAAGFAARGFDIRPPAAFGDFAMHMIDVATMRAETEILITVVRDAAETEALLFSDQAALSGPPLTTLIVSSTLSPRLLPEIAARAPTGLTLIDAPMSGAQVAAEERRLSFMLGGDQATLDRLQPLFAAMGAAYHRMGGFGAGMAAKVLNNYVAAASVASVRQALEWAGPLGLDRERLLKLMHDSSGQTWFGSNFERIEFAGDGYQADNTIGILPKDVAAALDGVGAPDDPVGRAVIERLKRLTPLEKE